MKRGRINDNDNVDVEEGELQQLPEGVIQRILSYLEPIDATKVGRLSKTLYHAWSLQPIRKLEFDDNKYVNEQVQGYSDGVERVREEFINYAEKSLERYRSHNRWVDLLHLTIRCDTFTDPSDFLLALVRMVEVACPRRIRVFYSSLGCYDHPDLFRFLGCMTLEEFYASGCDLVPPVDAKRMIIRCGLLSRLTLINVNIDDITFEAIITACPWIQDLRLCLCRGLKAIKLVNLHCLKDLHIFFPGWNDGDAGVEVRAPSLESFSCYLVPFRKFTLHTPCCHLKKLELKSIRVEQGYLFQDLENKFPRLECLTARFLCGFERLQIKSKSLKSLTITGISCTTTIDVPRLISFEYEGRELPKFEYSLESNICECHLTMSYPIWIPEWFIELRQLLKKLITSKISLSIVGCSSNAESRLTLIQPQDAGHVSESRGGGVEVEDLSLILASFNSQSNYSILLHNLFWSCQPKSMAVGLYENSNKGFVNYLCQRLIDAGNNHPRNDNKLRWENHLKEATIDVVSNRRKLETEEEGLAGSFHCETFLVLSSQGKFEGMNIFVRFKWERKHINESIGTTTR